MGKLTFQKATKKQARARIGIYGIAKAGKSWTSQELATLLGQKVAVIDSERGSASKYSDRFAFDVLELDSYGPEKYVEAIQAAEAAGYDVIVIDSLSHAWSGKDGILERVDRKGGMTGGGWRDATPQHNRLVDAILTCKAHVIVTLRAKTAYEYEKNDKGKIVPRKVGLAPVQRDGLEYEFDVLLSIDGDHNINVEGTRCEALDGRTFHKQNPEIAGIIKAWLTDGAPIVSTTDAVSVATKSPQSSGEPVPATPLGASAPTCAASATATHTMIDVAKTAFPAATPVDQEREEALIEARRLIAESLKWEISQAREAIRNLTGGKKSTTKELDRAEAIALRDHLTGLAAAAAGGAQ